MPRTGQASELIKQVMGLLMFAAAAYFLGTGLVGLTTTPPDPPSKLYWWAWALCILATGFWLIARTMKITKSPHHRAIFLPLGGLMVIGALLLGIRFTD